jgi:hypothetical protein
MIKYFKKNVHTSGSAELKTFSDVVTFIRDYLVDIKSTDENIELKFNTSYKNVPNQFIEIKGYKDLGNIEETSFSVFFDKNDKKVRNNDTVSTINKVKDILRRDSKVTNTPADYYSELISNLLSVGNIYSSYVEIMLAHMFITDIENKKFWRYNQQDSIVLKLSDKTMAAFISPLLGLLYQPNERSISSIDLDEIQEVLGDKTSVENLEKLSIHEKIFLEMV